VAIDSGFALLFTGTLIAFACAVIAVAIDLQDAVKAQLGALANTSILGCWQGWVSIIGWGIFDAAMYHMILNNKEWATSTFGFRVDQNLLWTGLVVGISAIVVIRSKLAKVGSVEVGGEWVYLWTRAKVLNAVNKRRVNIKQVWQSRFRRAVNDVAGSPTFFTDLETRFVSLLLGRPDITSAVLAQIADLRKQYVPAGDPNADDTINANPRARAYLVNVGLDYFGPAELLQWATQAGIAI
jgi:hypothetical protein